MKKSAKKLIDELKFLYPRADNPDRDVTINNIIAILKKMVEDDERFRENLF